MKLVLHNGPVIPRVQSVSLNTDALAVTFLTPTAASIAHLATGWPFTIDDRTLLASLHPLIIHPPQDPAAGRRSIAGWTLAEDSAPAIQQAISIGPSALRVCTGGRNPPRHDSTGRAIFLLRA